MLVLPAAVVKEGVVASAIVVAPLRVFAPVEVRNVPLEPDKSKLPEAEVAPLIIGAVKVLFVRVEARALRVNVSLAPFKFGIVKVAGPVV